jgi:ferredoxin
MQVVKGRGACHHPDGTSRFIASALEVFAEDVAAHVADGTCGRPVRGLLPIDGEEAAAEEAEDTGLRLTVDWTRCAGHGLCGHLIPDLVSLDEHGFPVVESKTVPQRLLRQAHQAIEMCPALALRLKNP